MPQLQVTSFFGGADVSMVEVTSTNLKDAIVEMMKQRDPIFSERDERNLRNHMDSGEWFGGQWIVNPTRITFDTDVGWTEFELV